MKTSGVQGFTLVLQIRVGRVCEVYGPWVLGSGSMTQASGFRPRQQRTRVGRVSGAFGAAPLCWRMALGRVGSGDRVAAQAIAPLPAVHAVVPAARACTAWDLILVPPDI